MQSSNTRLNSRGSSFELTMAENHLPRGFHQVINQGYKSEEWNVQSLVLEPCV